VVVELKIPSVGESITEVEIGEWLKAEGDRTEKDENLVVIETEKVTFELAAPVSGIVTKVLKKKGAVASVGEVIGYMEAAEAATEGAPKVAAKKAEKSEEEHKEETRREERKEPEERVSKAEKPRVMPAAQRVLAERGLRPEEVRPSGPGGRLLKEDVLRHVGRGPDGREKEQAQTPARTPELPSQREEEVVAMSPMRRRIAQRLVEAQQTAALLTTFNEIDMAAVMSLREKHQVRFQDKYQVKLGFMSFFVKAAIDALKLVPQVNAEIRGNILISA
jgi:2-oxoglutarate dehydrogenase E2 component (dihydrolipoamide succinyltransferase)